MRSIFLLKVHIFDSLVISLFCFQWIVEDSAGLLNLSNLELTDFNNS